MPAFYTHYRFGCDVLKQLPEDIRDAYEQVADFIGQRNF